MPPPFQWAYSPNVGFLHGIRPPNHWVEACRKAVQHCLSKNYPIEKLAIQYSVSNPRIATTLFSSANPDNVLKNITYAEEPIDWNLVKEVQEIIGEQMRVSWANS